MARSIGTYLAIAALVTIAGFSAAHAFAFDVVGPEARPAHISPLNDFASAWRQLGKLDFLSFRSRTQVVFLDTPRAAEGVVAVSTTLQGTRSFHIDVDLNHDGVFSGPGELGYAEGRFDKTGAGRVRLHGLVEGRYRARARVGMAGREATSDVGIVEVPTTAKGLPVRFEPNRGQADSVVLFLGRAQNQTVYVTSAETVLATTGGTQRFRLHGVSASARPVGRKKLDGVSHYLVGNDPSMWRTNVETYPELLTPEVYPGIDLVYHSNRGHLEYDFHVSPGADPSVICLEFPDAIGLSLDAHGGLVIRQADGQELRKSAPIMYQDGGGTRQAVKGGWVSKGNKRAGYVIADYDRHRELVIDPLVFSTYFGGLLNDVGNAIAVDGAGNSYVAGSALSLNFPVTAGSLQTTSGGPGDAVIVKLNPTGTTVLYSTYLGGAALDSANAITVDSTGNVYIAGQTSSVNFPTTAGAYQTVFGGGSDAFVAKLNPTGSALVYSTYVGGTSADVAHGIAIDASGNAYITGDTGNNFPTTAGAFIPGFSGGAPDVFVAKLNPAGTALVYSTYLGGSSGGSADTGRAITVDAAGNAYVTGNSNSSDFQTTAGSLQPALAGGSDAFVAKFNPTGSALIYCTFIGGAGGDVGVGIAIDPAGNAYITGSTSSNNFPVTPGAFQTAQPGGGDAFVAKLNPAGNTLVYSTYLGGAGGIDAARAIALDAVGSAYVTGNTVSANFPMVNAVQPVFAGGLNDSGGSTNVTEGGTTDTYTVVLNSSPTANVTITLNPGLQLTVVPGVLTFTPLNWNVAQTVTVTAVDDAVSEGLHTGTITHTAASADAAYNGIAIANVVAQITDNEPGVTIVESGGSTAVPKGGSDTYTVVLNTTPAAAVTITLNPKVPLTAAPAVLGFTPANWNVPQTVSVSAVGHLCGGLQFGSISHTTVSADPLYNGIGVPPVSVTIIDNMAGEGSYPCSQGLGGSEGTFGFGGDMMRVAETIEPQAIKNAERLPVLQGPFQDGPDGTKFQVLNVSHRRANDNILPSAGGPTGLVGWSLLSILALGLVALLGMKVLVNGNE